MKPINLNRREKYYVTAAAGVIVVFLIFQLVIFPILSKRERLARTLDEKTADLQKMRSLQADYLALENREKRAKLDLSKRDKNFSLGSFLERLADEVGITISDIESSSDTVNDIEVAKVELKISTITMEQLTTYLYQVEYSGNNLFVNRMTISETSKPEGYIDVAMTVETIES